MVKLDDKKKEERYYLLDSVRGICILGMIIYHMFFLHFNLLVGGLILVLMFMFVLMLLCLLLTRSPGIPPS